MRFGRFVVSIAATLAMVAATSIVPQIAVAAGPVISVTADYSGADAQAVADTVAAPVEEHVDGAEGSVWLRSRSTDDGRYLLQVQFRDGFDRNIAKVLVQNRVGLATPVLPDVVVKAGVTIQIETPVALILALRSTDGRQDLQQLAHARDELLRLSAVGRVDTIGDSEREVRVCLALDKLNARNLAAGDVVAPLKENLAQLPKRAKEPDLDAIRQSVVKTSPDGKVIRLQDIASIEFGAGQLANFAYLDGKRIVALAIHPRPDIKPAEAEKLLQKELATVRANMPQGVDVSPCFVSWPVLGKTFPPHSEIVVEATFPGGTSVERMSKSLLQFDSQVRKALPVKAAW